MELINHDPTATVLVIDDDITTTATFEHVLRLEGYSVVTATDAKQGLSEAIARQPDAILLDLHMPQLDGLEFLRRLREVETRRTAVVVVTGDYFVNDSTAADLRALGADIRFKPLWVEDILDTARSLTAPSGSDDGARRQERAHELVHASNTPHHSSVTGS